MLTLVNFSKQSNISKTFTDNIDNNCFVFYFIKKFISKSATNLKHCSRGVQ